MADAARRAQTVFASHDRAHQFVGVQAAFHDRLGLAAEHQFDGLVGRRVTVRHIDDRIRRDVDAGLAGRLADSSPAGRQDRLDQAQPRGADRTLDGGLIAGMDDGSGGRRQAFAGVEQALVFGVVVH